MRIAGPRRCVVWANVFRPAVAGRGYAGYNRALRVEDRRRANLIVFDWVRMARQHPWWFGPDRVHPSAAGYGARARALARLVGACRP
jgi:hypothetical protein